MTDGFEGWRFDAKSPADRALDAPRVAPDGPAAGVSVMAVLSGAAALTFVALCEGALAWLALRWAAELGWIDRPAWLPVLGMAVAITYLRGIDRAVFTRR